MRDCENVELRDALPDFAADRLTGADRARVAAHIADCPECAAEVELLRAAYRSIAEDTPRIDVARMVAALPLPPGGVSSAAATGPVLVRREESEHGAVKWARPTAGRVDRVVRQRPMWMGWRIAAVASTIAVGGLSIAVLRNLTVADQPRTAGHTVVGTSRGLPAATPGAVSQGGAGTGTTPGRDGGQSGASGDTQSVGSPASGLSVAGSMSDLSDGEIEGLLNELDGLEASPSEEPDASAPALHSAVTP